jgi:hypothetical protein
MANLRGCRRAGFRATSAREAQSCCRRSSSCLRHG